MRIFPVIVKRVQGGGSDPIDYTINLGTDDQSMPVDLSADFGPLDIGTDAASGLDKLTTEIVVPIGSKDEALTIASAVSAYVDALGTDAQDALNDLTLSITTKLGTDTQGMTVPQMTLTIGVGTETDSVLVDSLAAVAATALGTDAGSIAWDSAFSTTHGVGTDSASHAASGTLVGSGLAATISQSGSDWTDIANIGVKDTNDASIVAQAGAASGDSYNDTITTADFGIVAAPAGWTRDDLLLRVRHQWDVTVGLAGSTVSHEIIVDKAAGGSSTTVFSRTGGGGNQSPFATFEYDLVTPTSGWSDAEIEGIVVDFDATCNLLVLGGNASWDIQWAEIEATFSRAGIS